MSSDTTLTARLFGTSPAPLEIRTARPARRPSEDAPDRLTEAGAAERFCRLHGEDVRFDHQRQRWLLWRGHRWQPDEDEHIIRLGLEFARLWQRGALEIADLQRREATVKAAMRLERRPALDSMLRFAAALRPIADTGTDWDRDPWLLGTPNGVIDLRTGQLRDGRREDRITMNVGVPYDPNATCPRWQRFVSEIFNDDDELVTFVQRAVGYSLTGDTSEQCLFLCHGTGANGKSTFLRTLAAVLGEYAHSMPFSTIELHQRGTIPNDLAALVGRRFVTASETNDGTRLNESRIKALTGEDAITARFLHAEFFTFVPVAKFWLAVNHKPVVRDDSYAFWRRIRLIPFLRTFPGDKTLGPALRAEGAGILTWAVRGCLEWQREGLPTPAAVTEATETYAHESDPLRDFLDEATERAPDCEIAAGDLYDAYRRWAETHGLNDRERLTSTAFGRKMSERFRWRKNRAGKVYLDIARRTV
jgi:putative DNA primase/helicase